MKILVTGGGGFLGEHLIRALTKLDHEVISFSRSHYPELTKLGVKQHCGNISNLDELEKAMQGVNACFHVASKVSMWGKWKDFYQTNVIGTQNIIKACKNNGVKNLIYTSSPSVVFGDHSLEGVNETTVYPEKTYSLYGKSKALAEKEALAANSDRLKVISLRPHLIFGPGDRNLIPGLIEAAENKRLKIIGKGQNKVDVLYIDNAVDAHLCALNALVNNNKDAFGKAYFIGQGPVILWDFINEILVAYKLSPITKRINFKITYFLGFLTELFYKIFNIKSEKPPMTRFVALQLAKHHYFDHKRANVLLGWNPKVSVKDGIEKLVSKSF